MILYLWKATVPGFKFKTPAISFIDIPSASSCRTSLWRRVILFSSAEESPLLKRNSTVSFVISGDRYYSDLRARRIALTNSSAAELFTMYPEAPRRNASAATSGDMFIVR